MTLDPSRETNRHAYVAYGALLRARGEKRGARGLLEDLQAERPGDPYCACALAAVYLDYVEENGEVALLGPARKLIGVAWAQQQGANETRALYGRLDSLARRSGG